MLIKDYIAKQFIGHKYRFWCDCIVKLDIIGTVKNYIVSNNEIILTVATADKDIKIGLNTPSLQIAKI